MWGDAGSNPALINLLMQRKLQQRSLTATQHAEIAQLVERSPEEPRVPGSIPGLCANLRDVHCIRTAPTYFIKHI